MRIPFPLSALSVALISLSMPAFAAEGEGDDRVAALEARLAALEGRLQAAEARATAAEAAQAAQANAPRTEVPTVDLGAVTRRLDAMSWAERVQVKGDLRVRHDSLDQDSHDARQRSRYRARLGLTAKVNDTITTGLGLASGNADPISRNETFDNAASTKGINLEQAWLTWKPADVAGLEITGGKFKQPFRTAGDAALVWDNDLNPEGLTIAYQRAVGGAQVFGIASGWWIDERDTAADAFMAGAQAGVKLPTFGNGDVTLAAATYQYNNTQGRTPYFDAKARGNTLRGGTYESDFRLVELFADWRGNIGPATANLFGDWVRNNGAERYDTAYAVGASLAHHGYSVGYAYKDVEADAVLGTFADSDFGFGGTDVRGHLISLGYEASKVLSFKLTWANVEQGGDANVTQDADRVQLDMQVKY